MYACYYLNIVVYTGMISQMPKVLLKKLGVSTFGFVRVDVTGGGVFTYMFAQTLACMKACLPSR